MIESMASFSYADKEEIAVRDTGHGRDESCK